MTKRKKNRQYNDQKKEGQTIQWPKERSTGNTMIETKEGQTIQWSKERRTDNTMTKRNNRQNYDQKKGQIM
jgi:hypothetical protein